MFQRIDLNAVYMNHELDTSAKQKWGTKADWQKWGTKADWQKLGTKADTSHGTCTRWCVVYICVFTVLAKWLEFQKFIRNGADTSHGTLTGQGVVYMYV